MTRHSQLLLILVLAMLVLVNVAAALQVAQSIPTQLALGASYPPGARLAVNLLWAALFADLIMLLLCRPQTAIHLVLPLLMLYGMAGVGWLSLFARSDFDRGRIAFQAVFTAILLVPIAWLCRNRLPRVVATGSGPALPPESPYQPPNASPGQPEA